jgi:hypothetical protein
MPNHVHCGSYRCCAHSHPHRQTQVISHRQTWHQQSSFVSGGTGRLCHSWQVLRFQALTQRSYSQYRRCREPVEEAAGQPRQNCMRHLRQATCDTCICPSSIFDSRQYCGREKTSSDTSYLYYVDPDEMKQDWTYSAIEMHVRYQPRD